MNVPESDLVVVGGGPAGLISAKTAANKGIDVILFDSNKDIGLHEHCAGLLSIQGLADLNLDKLPSDIIQNDSIKGAIIYSPSGNTITVEKEHPTAYVVNRSKFDQHLAQLAIDSGVDIRLSSRVTRIERDGSSLLLSLGKKKSYQKFRSNLAILAEGRFPRLNEQIGLLSPKRNRIVFSSMYIMNDVKDINSSYVELYQDQRYAPGFFSWIIPVDDNTAKVGLASLEVPASSFLNNFMKNHPVAKLKLKNAKITQRMNGAIPLGSNIKRTFTNNILTVGDAAGQTKPTTGGGVIFGGIAAQFAGQIASDAVKQNRFDKRYLSQYSKLWKKELRSNLYLMKLVRKYIDRLTTDEVERLFLELNKPRFTQIISQKGDVDNQKEIILRLLTEIKLWPFLLKTGLRVFQK